MSNTYRFHVTLGESKRSTVSLPKFLLVLFSLKQGWPLDDQKTLHRNVRLWCNETLQEYDYNEHAINYSQFLQQQMVETLVDKKISKAYDGLFPDDDYQNIKF